MDLQRQAYLLRVLRSHRNRVGKDGELPARKWSTAIFWVLFCLFLAKGAVFANLLLSAFFVLFLGALDLRAHWGLPGGSFGAGRGVLRYFGGLGLLIGSLLLNSHVLPALSLKLLLVSGLAVLAVPLIQELVLGEQLFCALGRAAKRQIVFALLVSTIESDRARLALSKARKSLEGSLRQSDKAAQAQAQLLKLQDGLQAFRSLLVARHPRTYP